MAKNKLEEDSDSRFMASNGLVANPSQTKFLLLNANKVENEKINIGNSLIIQESSAKLLGVKIDDSQKWSNQINGKGGIILALNSRLFPIKRLRSNLAMIHVTSFFNIAY